MQFFANLPDGTGPEDTEKTFEELTPVQRLDATRADLRDLDELYVMTSLALTSFPPPNSNKNGMQSIMGSFAAIQTGVMVNISRQLDLVLRKLYIDEIKPDQEVKDGQ